MNKIREELFAKYYLPPIKKYPHPTEDWYRAFLLQTDFITAKLAEAMALGKTIDEYTEELEAREYCRECINAIQEGTYDGEEAMQEIDIVLAEETSNITTF